MKLRNFNGKELLEAFIVKIIIEWKFTSPHTHTHTHYDKGKFIKG